MESVQVQNKFKMLFEKVCEPGYIMNNYYVDGLIIKLTHDTEPEILTNNLLSMLTEWLSEALTRTLEKHVTVRVFLTRLVAVTSKNELQFCKLFAKQGDILSQGFKDINNPNVNPSLRVAYMEVALAIESHNSGVSWLLERGVWKEILSLCNEKQTVFVVRQTYKFTSQFVWKLNDMNDEANVRDVINYIVRPINKIDLVNMLTISSEQEEEFGKDIKPMILMLQAILSEVDRIQKPNIVVNTISYHSVLSYLYLVSDRVRNLTKEAIIAASWYLIAKTFINKPVTPETIYFTEDFNETMAAYFNTIQTLVMRRATTTLLDFVTAFNLNWSLICKSGKIKFSPDCVKVHNQLLIMNLCPIVVYIKEFGKTLDECYGRIEECVDNILKECCEHTTRAGYALRELILQLDSRVMTVNSVKRLNCLKNHLNNAQANLVFQALFYVLILYEQTTLDESGDFEENQDLVLMMTYVLDTVLWVVKNHDITWHESLEVICLHNIVFNILKRPNLSCKFIVTALNVIGVTVKKFLPPNLSLLMESKPGSAMDELGNLIYMKLHDRNWEIRDSALELLLVCTEISFVKFPPFQKQLNDNNLINVAATISLHDHEFYVQASALKCIAAATKIAAVWDHLLEQYPDILDKLIFILRNNQEGIVRKEASCVLREVYQNLKLSPAFKQTLYEHMVSTTLADFHWEVQLNGLCFWKVAIQSCLNDQGMLDGTFPPVTFSRETRKIVTLNDVEIQKRLVKTLDELAQIGCLTVFVKLLNEDTEVEILDATLTISNELLEILNKYKVPDVVKLNENEIGTVEELLLNIKEEDDDKDVHMSDADTAPKADKVIDGIVNADDINLLANIYESHMKIEPQKIEGCTPKIKLLKFASPYLFVNHLKKDFKAIVEQKKKWKEGIRSISSLLDDVLGIYEINEEVNTLDCY